MRKGFVDAAWRADVNEDLGNFDEGDGINTKREEFAGSAGTLISEAEVEHRIITAVLHDEWVGGEAAIACVGCGWLV